MKEYVATFETSEQISEDSWRVITPSMKLTEETTIGEIEKFYRKYYKMGETYVKIIELHNPLPTKP